MKLVTYRDGRGGVVIDDHVVALAIWMGAGDVTAVLAAGPTSRSTWPVSGQCATRTPLRRGPRRADPGRRSIWRSGSTTPPPRRNPGSRKHRSTPRRWSASVTCAGVPGPETADLLQQAGLVLTGPTTDTARMTHRCSTSRANWSRDRPAVAPRRSAPPWQVSPVTPWATTSRCATGSRTPRPCAGRVRHHGPIGPWVVTADELNPADVKIARGWTGSCARWLDRGDDHRVADMISALSKVCTLEPGDLWPPAPRGVGCSADACCGPASAPCGE